MNEIKDIFDNLFGALNQHEHNWKEFVPSYKKCSDCNIVQLSV